MSEMQVGSIGEVLEFAEHDLSAEVVAMLGEVNAQEFVNAEGMSRVKMLVSCPVEKKTLAALAAKIADILEKQVGMKPAPTQAQLQEAVAGAHVTTTTVMTATTVTAMRADDDMDLSSQGESMMSVSGFGGVSANFDPAALTLVGQASMALLMIDAGLLSLLSLPSFWKAMNLPVGHDLRAIMDEIMTEIEDVENIVDKAVGELRAWLAEVYPAEFMKFISLVAKMNSMNLATTLAGAQSQVNVTDMAEDLGAMMALLPLIAERVTVFAEQSSAPNRVSRLIKLINKVVNVLKNRDLHSWVGGKVAVAKTDADAAMALIQHLAPNANMGLQKANQIRVALGYESVWSGFAGFLTAQTVRNLKIVGARGMNLWAGFQMLKGENGQSEGSFRSDEGPQQSVRRATRSSEPTVNDEVRTAGGWSLTIGFTRS